VVALTLLYAFGASICGAQAPRSGKRAPEIDLPTLTGGRMELSKLRGHPVILSFWGTWCPPCRHEFPELVRLQAKHADAGLRVIGINGRDQEVDTKDVQRFVDFFSVTFPIALDKRGSVRRAYQIKGQPTTVFIDSSGVIRKIHVGLILPAELDSGIALILERPMS
jgi:peroxiredoxin